MHWKNCPTTTAALPGWLEAQGYRVIRFRNEELMGDLDAVLERIQLSL
jgi:very-short-patch-repair endonuclease